MAKPKEKESIGQSLDRLEKLVSWFDEQEQVQVEEGLAKAREGAALVKELRARLKEVENEFKEVRKELDGDDAS